MTSPCPSWCEPTHEADAHHRRDTYSGPGPGGTAHVSVVHHVGRPLEVQVDLDRDAPTSTGDARPAAASETYTALAARAFADLAAMDPHLTAFARGLRAAAHLVDAHQDPAVKVPHVSVPVPTKAWISLEEADRASRPDGQT